MSVTCYNSGRNGNIFFHQAMVLAYAKKHNLQYVIPKNADAYSAHSGHNRNPLGFIPSTGVITYPLKRFTEANIHTTPSYQDIPKMDNVLFDGYYQSFKYFDWCRDYILEQFKIPEYKENDFTSINYRRGDCIGSPNFPVAPKLYYQAAVQYMNDRGFYKFRIYGDDQNWAKKNFTAENFPNCIFEFSEGKSELEDWYSIMGNCNNITARSTFSLTAAWCNRNPSKIVCVPTTRHIWWRGMNSNLLTETGFIEIDFEKTEDEWSF